MQIPVQELILQSKGSVSGIRWRCTENGKSSAHKTW